MTRWHYTIGPKMKLILKDCRIKPTTALLLPGERPIAWFTERDDFEPTALKNVIDENGHMRSLSIEEMQEFGLFRIGVSDSCPLQPWLKICRMARMKNDVRKALERVAFNQGSDPYRFWGSLTPVPVKYWLAIEVRTDGRWIDALPPEVDAHAQEAN